MVEIKGHRPIVVKVEDGRTKTKQEEEGAEGGNEACDVMEHVGERGEAPLADHASEQPVEDEAYAMMHGKSGKSCGLDCAEAAGVAIEASGAARSERVVKAEGGTEQGSAWRSGEEGEEQRKMVHHEVEWPGVEMIHTGGEVGVGGVA